jgi:hypothetical protein
MAASDRRDIDGESMSRIETNGSRRATDGKPVSGPETVVGSFEHLQAAFVRAAAVADQAGGLWLARNSNQSTGRYRAAGEPGGPNNDLRALRALARAAATAYARRLKAEGLTPERMLVLVKAATSNQGIPGFGAQELTSDIVTWCIDAYFDE